MMKCPTGLLLIARAWGIDDDKSGTLKISKFPKLINRIEEHNILHSGKMYYRKMRMLCKTGFTSAV